ncbi:MAG: MerR family transcriptional regulator [Lachnospiraceae bacterium]|nr:MerR family transcriptional regulator [Lachnospiraceae bacterium]MBD5498960.1 MerR family transcriptional regulator [Lachnospiraceae bacterium]
MNHMTISEVSAKFQISTRMLRYYEKMGMIESSRKEDYAYRIYDENAVRRVQQIIILRKLQIPLKKIKSMMNSNRVNALHILQEQIQDMDENVKSVSTMKSALEKLLWLLQENTETGNYMELVQTPAVADLAELLPLEKHHFKEERNMSNTKEMVEKGSTVRIVLLAPCTVASYQYAGDNPEEKVGDVMDEFIRSSRLYEKKPDARLFGFNNPEPQPGNDFHGYEDCVTIPDDMEVPQPLVKKHFTGGLYAAYTINFPDFYEWQFLTEWVEKNEQYQMDYHEESEKFMGGFLEEHLNWVYASHMGWPENGIDGKVDLLLPIRPK